MKILLINAPSHYSKITGEFPPGTTKVQSDFKNADFIHLFAKSLAELEKQLPRCLKQLKSDGMIWVSWYKKSAGIPTNLTEDRIRDTALPLGLVDIKVCAVDDQWSGLKLVIRKENRK